MRDLLLGKSYSCHKSSLVSQISTLKIELFMINVGNIFYYNDCDISDSIEALFMYFRGKITFELLATILVGWKMKLTKTKRLYVILVALCLVLCSQSFVINPFHNSELSSDYPAEYSVQVSRFYFYKSEEDCLVNTGKYLRNFSIKFVWIVAKFGKLPIYKKVKLIDSFMTIKPFLLKIVKGILEYKKESWLKYNYFSCSYLKPTKMFLFL